MDSDTSSFTGLLPSDLEPLENMRSIYRAAVESPAGAENDAELPAALDRFVADLGRLVANLDRFVAATGKPLLLAFSGGLDSSLLACALRDTLDDESLAVLSTRDARRDGATAAAAARFLGLPCSIVTADEDSILEVIRSHREILRPLPDYTHRILAVCEIHLFARAADAGRLLVTGHGPEALLGGFHRRPGPSLDDPGRILDGLMANVARLNAVAAACGARVAAPFWNPGAVSILARMRRAGAEHDDMGRYLPAGFPLPESKSSLQNGSGVHYLFERMAEGRGFGRTRDFMDSLLS